MQRKRSIGPLVLRGPKRFAVALLAFGAILFAYGAQAGTIQIVALGASNTLGKGIGLGGSPWPAQLESMLRAKGYDVDVSNQGVNGDTTWGMAYRLDRAVPDGTFLVILNPANANDGGLKSEQAASIDQIRSRLAARNIELIVLPALVKIAPGDHAADGVHFTAEGHTKIAAYVLPQVISAIGPSAH